MPGQVISHYSVVRRLGAGGMGEVLLARDTKLERSVAIKLMSHELARDEKQRKRFRTEARAASGLNHPHICVIYEVGETEEARPFLVMEFVDGYTLDVAVQRRRLKLREIINIGAQAADALEAAHAVGIVHRDIKPANIMLDRRGQVKVLDFGLAKRSGLSTSPPSNFSSPDTETGFLIGTPNYMSPEQALGREVDHRADIFSLGVVLYELVAGQKPFVGATVGETINKIINDQPLSLGLENPLFTPTLDGIIFKCLAKDPARRYASARELGDDLVKLRNAAERATPAPVAPPAAPGDTKIWQLAEKSKRAPHAMLWAGATAALVLLIVGMLVVANRWKTPSGGAAPSALAAAQKSVAVLPFDNFSAERDTDYLSDGLTEEITSMLSRIPGLKVVARNSAFAFKGRDKDVRKVGAALGVGTVLEGSIRVAGKQVRVTAQLVSTADGYHLWSETYDRNVEDIIALQDEIARKIAERLQSDPTAMATLRAAVNPAAHRLYLQARHAWNKRSELPLKKAIQLFREALDLDPSYAAAHAGLAATYATMPSYSLTARHKEYMRLAKAEANRALESDPSCAEAHAVLGCTEEETNDPVTAEAHFRKAIQLDPNDATAHHWYGRFLSTRGRHQESLVQRRAALELDPLSPVINCLLPEWHYLNRDYARAVEECRRVAALFPEFLVILTIQATAEIGRSNYPAVLLLVDRARQLQPEEPLAMLDLRGFALARSGDETGARKILAQLEAARTEGKTVDMSIAVIHMGLREYDQAVAVLERYHASDGLEPGLADYPLQDELRGRPRYEALLKKIGTGP